MDGDDYTYTTDPIPQTLGEALRLIAAGNKKIEELRRELCAARRNECQCNGVGIILKPVLDIMAGRGTRTQ